MYEQYITLSVFTFLRTLGLVYLYIIIYIYLSGFDKRYLQKFLAKVPFETCLVLDHSCFCFFCLMIFLVQKFP